MRRDRASAAADAFGTLADPLRVRILRALWKRRGPVAFADLRKAVEVRDSGRFNYHLGELVGEFVRKTDDGYELRPAGVHAVNAVAAGEFTERSAFDATVGPDCPVCAGDLRARYRDGEFAVACDDCGTEVTQGTFPPRGVEAREGEELLAAYSRRVRHQLSLADDGVCPFCGGRTDFRLVPDAEFGYPELPAVSECGGCDGRMYATLGLLALDRPRVASFLRERGVAVDDRPFWEVPFCLSEEYVELVAADPPRAELRVPAGTETLRATFDRDVDIVAATVD